MAKSPQLPLPKSIVDALPSAVEVFKYLHAARQLVENDLRAQLSAAECGGAMQLARAFVALHRLHDHIDGFQKGFSEIFERYKSERVPESFEDERVTNAPLSEGFRVGTSLKIYASIRAGKARDALAYCRNAKLEDLIVESINAATLSSAFGTRIKETSREPPPDLFSIIYKPSTKVTPVKSKTAKTIGVFNGQDDDIED